MKKFFLLIIVLFGSLISLKLSTIVNADQYFDTYGKIPWHEEKAHLINFAIDLKNSPDDLAYIGFYTGEKDSFAKTKQRVFRAKMFLVRKLKIPESRIFIFYLGKKESSFTILQPTPKDRLSIFGDGAVRIK